MVGELVSSSLRYPFGFVLNALRHQWLVNFLELSALTDVLTSAQRLTASMVGELWGDRTSQNFPLCSTPYGINGW